MIKKLFSIYFIFLFSNVVASENFIYKDVYGNIVYSLESCKIFKEKLHGTELNIDGTHYLLNNYVVTGYNHDNGFLNCEFGIENDPQNKNVFSASIENKMYTSTVGKLQPFTSKYSISLSNVNNNNINILFIYDLNNYNVSTADTKSKNFIKELNNSFSFSSLNVSAKNVGFLPVDMKNLTLFDYADINTSIEAGTNGFSQVKNIISKTKADYYVFLSNKYGISNGKAIGGKVNKILGIDHNKKGNVEELNQNIYGMVIWDDFTQSALSPSHEMGHLFGLFHDRATLLNQGYSDADAENGMILNYAKGFAFDDGINRYGTIMSYESSYYKDQYFSNPKINKCGASNICGSSKDNGVLGADSYSALNITLPQILNFRNRLETDPTINLTTNDSSVIDRVIGSDLIL